MINLQAVYDFLSGYLLLLLLVGTPLALYARLAVRYTRNHCARLDDCSSRNAVVDYEQSGKTLAAIVAFDLAHLDRRDVIYRVSGEWLFRSDSSNLCERLRRHADREGVPLLMATRLEWNLSVMPGNDVARRYVPAETNMPRQRFLGLIAQLYQERGLEPPAFEGTPAGSHSQAFSDAA